MRHEYRKLNQPPSLCFVCLTHVPAVLIRYFKLNTGCQDGPLCKNGNARVNFDISNQNQIKSLLLSHHHSTSALVSEILMSVLQTVQKNNRQFTYGQTVQKNNRQFTYGQTVQKNNKQFTYGQTVQKSNSNLHMDSTYLQIYIYI